MGSGRIVRGLTWPALVAGIVAFVSLAAPAAPAAVPAGAAVERVELVPAAGTSFGFRDFRYGGTFEIRPDAGGLVVVESIDIDGYLAGIREVPFSWPEETLAAQVVAARSYLAWTLSRGRSGDGRTYGFDICASQQCQVYAGTGLVARADGDRWLGAIEQTAGEILVYGDAPAQTLYSSSAGPRTRSVEDIWGGNGVPYLVAVDSPEEGVSPHYEWEIRLPVEAVLRILGASGVVPGGDVRDVRVATTDDGGGAWTLDVETEQGLTSLPLTRVRAIFNRNGPRLYPGLLPARRDDGRRHPQAILSYTFEAEFVPPEASVLPARVYSLLPAADRPVGGTVVVTGRGWGHGVGMSQWGAAAMGEAGSGYDEILAHYYGGLEPVEAGALLPESVTVGLAWRRSEIALTADGPFDLRINGVPAAQGREGDWMFRSSRRGVDVIPPVAYETDLRSRVLGRAWPR